MTPTRGQPLLAMAVQYYFRRAVGEDSVLARELAWVKLTTIDRRVQDGFAFLALIQERHSQALEEALDGLARMEGVVVETRDAVLSLHADVHGLTDQFKLLRRELTAGHSVSYRDEHERELIEAVKRRYRALSDDQRRRFPQLGLDLSRLEIVAGDFQEALGEAREVAQHLDEPASRAEAHHAAYRAAIELRSWDEALAELRQAAAADGRFAAWPATKYQVERILGAGAFGVAFLCEDTYLDHQVVIKTFEAAGIDRDVATVFREARILRDLRNPGIIHLETCGFVDEVRKQRPYLVDRALRRQLDPGGSHPPTRPTGAGRSAVDRGADGSRRSRRLMKRVSGTAMSSQPTCSYARRHGAGRSRSSTSACRCGAAWSRPRRPGQPA